MIKYKIDIIAALKEKGYIRYKIRKEKIFGQGTVAKFNRKGHINISIDVLNTLCQLLECQVGDIIEYVEYVENIEEG